MRLPVEVERLQGWVRRMQNQARILQGPIPEEQSVPVESCELHGQQWAFAGVLRARVRLFQLTADVEPAPMICLTVVPYIKEIR